MLYSSGKIVNFQLICFQASAHNKNLDVGANIFIGNLDPEIDEKLLYDTFSAFGVILQTPKVPSNIQYMPNSKKRFLLGNWSLSMVLGIEYFGHTDLAAMNCLIDHQTMALCTSLVNQVYTHSTWTGNIQI